MASGWFVVTMIGMYFLGYAATKTKRHKDDGPKQKLLYAYVNFAFGIASACCIFPSILEGLAYSFVISIITASAPVVLNDVLRRTCKIPGDPCE